MATVLRNHNNSRIWTHWKSREIDIPKLGSNHQPLHRVRLLETRSDMYSNNLVVVLHGLDFNYPLPGEKVDCDHLNSFLEMLLISSEGNTTSGLADILLIDYHNHLFVHHKVAENLPQAVSKAVAQAYTPKYTNIVFIGHSFGSILARRVMVYAAEQTMASKNKEVDNWIKHATGLVSLAGTNLGFKIDKVNSWKLRILSSLAGITSLLFPGLVDALSSRGRLGRLGSYSWRNSSWVVDTRIKWLRLYEGTNKFKKGTDCDSSKIKNLSITGTMDALVGEDDQEMVYQLGELYCTRIINGIRHEGFLDPRIGKESDAVQAIKINEDEKQKLKSDIQFILNLSIARPKEWEEVERVSSLHAATKQKDQGLEQTVVFLIHGIRDNAEWQENIDYNLRKIHLDRFREEKNANKSSNKETPASEAKQNILISQIRYGYFSALQFLFPSQRRRAIRSFSDEYFRIIARFPDLKQENIHVYAHSNGTFVLGEALRKFSEIKVNRVLLGGSVLPPNFPWRNLVNDFPRDDKSKECNKPTGRQVMEIVNYAANHDAPTGLLCRGLGFLRLPFPGQPPWLGIGPGGTDGFKDLQNYNTPGRAGTVRGWNFFLDGDHGATLATGYDSPKGIATYLLGAKPAAPDPLNKFYTFDDLNKTKNPDHPLKAGGDRGSTRSYPSLYRNTLGNVIAGVVLAVALGLILLLVLFPAISPGAGPFGIIINLLLLFFIYFLSRL